jgi:integrase
LSISADAGKITWLARWRDPAGAQRKRSFPRKVDADRFLTTVEHGILTGAYSDPAAGKVTLRQYAGEWLAGQTFDESTREATELRLRLDVYTHLGDYPLASLRPSLIQTWLRGLQQTLAPRYVRVIFSNLSSVPSAAVDDGRLAKNPCRAASVRLPRLDPNKVEPWTREQMLAVRTALPDRVALVATLGAGLGLRQGEIFGLAVEDVDFLRGVVHVRRQVKIVGGKQLFALPKGRKVRDVPLPEVVALEIAAHLQQWPARSVELPWETTTGETVGVRLILSTRETTALERNYVNSKIWKPALTKAEVEPTRANGMHALRHFYASVLLDAGENIRALSEYLGHADPGFTLRVYTHLMPASENRTKRAVDKVLGAAGGTDESSRAPSVPQAAAD